jgi:hypothetical protein
LADQHAQEEAAYEYPADCQVDAGRLGKREEAERSGKDRDQQKHADSGQDADELRERVANCGADEKAFLQFAGAAKFEDIQKNRLVELKKMLAAKEAKNRA